MTMIRWDPFRNVTVLPERINRLFDDAFSGSKLENDTCSWQPAVDIFNKDQAVIFHMELPGIEKQQMTVDVKGNRLTVRGERKAAYDVNEDCCVCRERSFGSFQRSFTLSDHIDPEKIVAKFKDGILEITVPKPVVGKPKQVSVKVE